MNGQKKGAARSQQAAPVSKSSPKENYDTHIIAQRPRKASAAMRAQNREIRVLRCTLAVYSLRLSGLSAWQIRGSVRRTGLHRRIGSLKARL